HRNRCSLRLLGARVSLEWPLVAALGAASFVGALVQAATGFGYAILAAPVFLWAMNSTRAMAVLVGLHLVQSAMMVPRLLQHVDRRRLGLLAAGALVGCPLGLAILLRLDLSVLKIAVGIVILLAAALLIAREIGLIGARPRSEASPRPALTGATGIASGLLTALLVMPGPPLMLLAAADRLPRDVTRALSLTFFALCYAFVTALYTASGTFDREAALVTLLLAPTAALGTLIGARAANALGESRFRAAVLTLLVLSGAGALAAGLRG
ncbi:MAG TPA: sulfite exporter TauE/SafE family protein, partial [Hyphomicrobiaceae bacterium]|nr:sulfite exporter TauE/SafE family protein [Hyphomicrobiaceae bacterium]